MQLKLNEAQQMTVRLLYGQRQRVIMEVNRVLRDIDSAITDLAATYASVIGRSKAKERKGRWYFDQETPDSPIVLKLREEGEGADVD